MGYAEYGETLWGSTPRLGSTGFGSEGEVRRELTDVRRWATMIRASSQSQSPMGYAEYGETLWGTTPRLRLRGSATQCFTLQHFSWERVGGMLQNVTKCYVLKGGDSNY